LGLPIAKFSPTGDLLWATDLQTGNVGSVESIKATPDGGAIVTSTANGDVVVVRTGVNGNLVWTLNGIVGGHSTQDSYECRGLAIDVEGNAIVIGRGTTVRSIGGVIPNITDQAFIAKVDADGNELWFKHLAEDVQVLNDLAVLSDGVIAATGTALQRGSPSLNIVLFDPSDGSVLN
jgi:outer membrane protein assembly factor BamB